MSSRADPAAPSRVAGCYASELGDCTGVLSGEHWISAAVLRLFAERDSVSIRGLPWLAGEARSVPIPRLRANILCKGHNERLSRLDALALVWARQLGVGVDGVVSHDSARNVVINGHEFERWLLKLLCGLGVSGNLAREGDAIRTWKPPLKWLRILFGHADFAAGEGIYSRRVAPRDIGPYFVVTPCGPPGGLAAALIEVPGQALLLSCEPPPPHLVQGGCYRPLVVGNTLFRWRQRDRGADWAEYVEGVSSMAASERPRRSRRARRRASSIA